MIKNIGRYQIQGEIGKGGFGKVYRAWDPTVNRQVAIKILTVQGDDDLLTRFQNEAAAAGNLHHKNIVTVHDFGEHNGTPYMVMQLLEGENLQDIMSRNRPLTLLDKLNIMQEVAEGLHCAHQHGIVHRDVKPANIMILPDESVQIMDFGIARVTASASRQTRTGFVIGTVLYMSPEQFLPNMEVDYRADIWAYGVIYYELLTGKHPFAAPEQTGILYQIAHVDPPPVNSIAPDCPPALADVVQRALMKDREFRYQSLKELQFDVQPILLDLKRERAYELMSSARDLADGGQIDQANVALQRILELDPANRDAHSLMTNVKQQLHRRNVQPRIDGLVKRADEFVTARNYRQAAESIEAALKLSQTDSALRAKLEQIRKLQEQALKAEKLVNEARQQLEAQNLTAAFRSASEALETDPQNTRASQIISMVNTEMDRRDARRRLEEGLNRAKTLVLLQNYDEAITLLSDLVASHPEESAIIDLLNSARYEKEQQERRQRRWREMNAAREALNKRDFDGAISRLQTLKSDFADDPEVAQLLLFAREELASQRRTEAIDRVSREVQQRLDREDFDQALRMVEQTLGTYPGDPTLLRLLQSTTASKASHQRRLAVSECIHTVEILRREGRIEDALRRVNATMLEGTEEPQLTELRTLLQREYDAYRRAESLRRELESADRYITEGSPDHAIAIAERLRSQHPDEPRIAELLAKAQEAKEQQAQQFYLQKQLQEIAALEQVQDWRGALFAAQEGLSRQPNAQPFVTAFARIQQRIAEEDRANRIAGQAAAIREVVSARNFGKAEELLRAARKEFPGEPVFQTLTEQAVAAKRASEIDGAMGKIREAWRSGQLSSCRQQLAAALATYPAEQRLVALEQEIASQIYAEATRVAQEELKRRHFEAAHGAVLRALEWRPQDPAATSLLSAIAREQQLDAAIERIRTALDAGRFDECRDLLTAASKTYPGEPRIATLDEELKSRACNASLAEARAHIERGEFEAAEAAARRTLQFRSDDKTAASILAKVESERQIATVLTRVEQSRREGDAVRSRELIAVALKKYPTEPRLIALAEQIQTDVFSQALNAARRDLEAGRIAEAESAVNKALQLRPGDPSASALLSSIQTEKDIAETLASAKQAWRTGEFDKCRDLLAAGSRRHPHEERLRKLEEEFRAKVVDDLVSAARNHLAQQRFDAAKQSATHALAYKPGDKEISALLQTIAGEQSIEDSVARAVSARRAGQLEKSLEILKNAVGEHPSAQRLLTLDREIREQGFNESIGLAREQLGRQRFEQAIKAAETALVFRPNDASATALITSIRTEKEIESVIEKAQATRRSGKLAEALAIVAAAPRSTMSEARLKQLADEIAKDIANEKEAQQREQTRRRAEEEERKREAEARQRAEEERKREAEAQRRVEEARKRQAEEEARRRAEEEKARKLQAEEEARRRAEEEKARKRAEEEARKRAEEEKALKKLEEERARKQALEEQARRRAEEEARRRAEEEARKRKQAEEDQARARAAAASSTTILKTGTLTPVEPVSTPIDRVSTPVEPPQPVNTRVSSPTREIPKPPAPEPPKSKSTLIAVASGVVVLVAIIAGWMLTRDSRPTTTEPTKTPIVEPQTQTPSQPQGQTPNSSQPATAQPARNEITPPVTQPPPTPVPTAALQVMQSRLSFAWQRGTPPPSPQTLTINGSKQSFLATASARWVAVSPNRASAPRAVSVSVRPDELPPGTHTDTIRVAPTDNSFSPQNVVVELVVTPEARPVEVAKPTQPPPEVPKPTPPVTQPQAPTVLPPSPAAEGRWFNARSGTITYSGSLPPGGRFVINTTALIDGVPGSLSFSRTPPPFDAVRIDKISPGVKAVTRGYDLEVTNTSGAPIHQVVIEWTYQAKR